MISPVARQTFCSQTADSTVYNSEGEAVTLLVISKIVCVHTDVAVLLIEILISN